MLALGLVVTTASPARADGLPFGDTPWTWGSPQPQGVGLTGISARGSHAFAFGTETAIESLDGGITWSRARAGLEFTDLEFLDDRTLIAAVGCSFYRSDDGGRRFAALPTGAPLRDSECVASSFSFPTKATGYVQLGGTVLRTGDGGRTFTARTPVENSTALRFVSPDVGFALAGSRIFRTTDGARSWTQVASSEGGFTDITFIDGSRGFAVGNGGLLRTTDGGVSWATAPLAGVPRIPIEAISCAGPGNCLMLGAASPPARGRFLIRTSDGGESGRASTNGASAAALAFQDTRRVLAVGSHGLVLASQDGGMTFRELSRNAERSYYKLVPGSGRVAYANGQQGFARTVDGGRNWQPLALTLTGREVIQALSFDTRGHGVAIVKASGSGSRKAPVRLARSDDSGATWRTVRSGRLGDFLSVTSLSARRVIADGRDGVRLSLDGGRRFRAIRSRTLRRVGPLRVIRTGPYVAALGDRRLAISRGGSRWTELRLPSRGEPTDISFVSRRTAYVAIKGRAWRTRNRGRSWSPLSGFGDYEAQRFSFADARHGFAIAELALLIDEREQVVLRTDDGGRSWRPQVDGGVYASFDVAAIGRTGGIVARDGDLAWTARAGDPATRRRLSLRASRSRLKRPGFVVLKGRIRGGATPAEVRISRGSRAQGWSSRRIRVRGDGRFRLRVFVRRNAVFVAQLSGNRTASAAATRAIRVRVRR